MRQEGPFVTERDELTQENQAAVPDPDAKVPAYSWYALGVLVLIYILNFIFSN